MMKNKARIQTVYFLSFFPNGTEKINMYVKARKDANENNLPV